MTAAHVRSSRRNSFGTELFNLADTDQRSRWNGLLGPTFTAAGWQEGDTIQEVGSGLILQLRMSVGGVGPRWQGVNCNVFLCFTNASAVARHRFVTFTGGFGVAQATVAGEAVQGLSMGSTTGVLIEPVYVLVGGVFWVESSASIAGGSFLMSTSNGRSAVATTGLHQIGWSIGGTTQIGLANADLVNFKTPVPLP